MNRFALLLAALLLTVVTTACNTVAGAGKDMQDAGTNVQDEANEHK
jgi:predicted small secreted protein